MSSFKSRLEEVINYTADLPRTYLTVSDIDNIITQNYLDKIQADREIEKVYLAGSLQQGFIYHFLNQGDVDDAYLVQMIWEYRNKLDTKLLKRSWQLAQRKYPSLRLRLKWDEELLQIIDKEGILDWRYIDLSNIKDITEQGLQIKRIQEEDRKERYNLEEGNLFRIYIIKHKNDLYTCIFSNHHAILDGWSSPILLEYVHKTYIALSKGETIDTNIDQSYLDTQKYIQETQGKNESYWKERITKIGDYLDLGTLLSSEVAGRTLEQYKHIIEPKSKTLTIKNDLYKSLKSLSKEEGVTLNAVLQYVWHRVLVLYGSNNDKNITTVVGTTVSGRELSIDNIESSVGLYINTLPLVVEHDDQSTSVLDAIRKVQEDITEINIRSSINLSKLQKDGRRLFDTLFVFENYPNPISQKGDDDSSHIELKIEFKGGIEKLDYPIAVIAYEGKEELIFTLQYAGELFAEKVIERIVGIVNTILKQIGTILQDRKLKIKDLRYLSKEDEELVLRK
ncbi:MAG: hypothetical protein EBX37_08660, partial [Alphaproteobacteria bacterium]|nr:hypothetical protein [Alphaproteobacteria bacterium]